MLEKAKKVASGSSTGLSVIAAFLGAALVVLQLVKTVSEDEPRAAESSK